MYKQRFVIGSSLVIGAMFMLGCMSSHSAAGETKTPGQTKTGSESAMSNQTKIESGLKKESKPISAETAGWELLFHDTFDRKELGEQWKVIDGTWEMVDGNLRGSGTIVSCHGFPAQMPSGFQRLEFEAISDIRPLMLLPGTKPKVIPSDMDGFIHAQSYEAAGNKTMMSGYFFQFGGNNNTANRIRQKADILWEDQEPQTRIILEKWHRIVLENDKGTLRFYVDDELLYEQKLTSIVMGESQNRVGLYFLSDTKVRDLKVYVKRMPNPLDLD